MLTNILTFVWALVTTLGLAFLPVYILREFLIMIFGDDCDREFLSMIFDDDYDLEE